MVGKKVSNKTLSRNFKGSKTPVQFIPLVRSSRSHRADPHHPRAPPAPEQRIVCNMTNQRPAPPQRQRPRLPVTIRPFLTVRFTMKSLGWIIAFISLYLVCGTMMMLQDGPESVKTIVVFSVMGFATFFMGYFGWIVARDVLEAFNKMKQAQEETVRVEA